LKLIKAIIVQPTSDSHRGDQHGHKIVQAISGDVGHIASTPGGTFNKEDGEAVINAQGQRG
jgi:hypothetical protein